MSPPRVLRDLFRDNELSSAAVVAPDVGAVSYGELSERVDRTALGLLDRGVEPGDVIGIALVNGIDFLVAFLAITWVRAVAAPFNPGYTADELRFYLEDANATAVIVPEGAHASRDAATDLGLAQWVVGELEVTDTAGRTLDDPKADDVALFLHTSGTTSRPKGVPLTHGSLMASIRNIVDTYQLSATDTTVVVMPLFHVHGLVGATLSTLSSGGSVALPERFRASSFWDTMEAVGATWYTAVPTIHQILLERQEGPRRSLRFIRSCSSALAPAVGAELEARFGAPVLEAYGMTEASHQVASSPLPPAARKPGSVGPGTGVEITIIDGEVCIRGANVMTGYVNNPDANAEAFIDGWFRTGDQGSLDEHGYLRLTGRIKELINRGGEKISPLEVDAALFDHADVEQAVTFGVPDAKYGEEVNAVVVPREGKTLDPEELQSFCRGRLAEFKVPKRIFLATEVPRTATGKVQRRVVAAHFAGEGGGA